MREALDPAAFGLTRRDRIERVDEGRIALVVDRKSRIVMADGERLVRKIETIRENAKGWRVDVRTNAPVCGKTRAFLSEKGVEVLEMK